MTEKDMLNRLWESNRDRTFALFSVAKLLKLAAEEERDIGNLLDEMHREKSTVHGYRVKRVAIAIYKLMKIVTTGEQGEQLEQDARAVEQSPCEESQEPGEASEQGTGQDASRNGCEMGGQREQTEQRTGQDPYPRIPQELKSLSHWCVWRSEKRNSKPTKVPYQVDDRHAKSNTPATWTDYQTACKHRARFSGIGFMFSKTPYTGMDLDNCIDENRKIKAWAQVIVDRLKAISYGEVSPSRRGIKFWTRAVLAPVSKHKIYINETTGEAIEIYDSGRFFAMTGHGKGEIGDGQETVDWILSEYFPHEQTQAKPSQAKPPSQPPPSHNEIIDKIQASRQAAKFNALMRGDTTGYGSPSEADCALCSMLAFWTQDRASIDAIFRQSRLMRDKWDVKHRFDGATYGQMTIETVLTGKTETYNPSRKVPKRGSNSRYRKHRRRRR